MSFAETFEYKMHGGTSTLLRIHCGTFDLGIETPFIVSYSEKVYISHKCGRIVGMHP